MAVSICSKGAVGLSATVLMKECEQRASLRQTRQSSSLQFPESQLGKGWKCTLQSSMGGLRVREGTVRKEKFSCRRQVGACAVQDNSGILDVIKKPQDSCLERTSTQQPSSANLDVLETWLTQDSVMEIVRNLQEAPFLQYIYNANKMGQPERHLLSQEFFDKPDTWSPVRKCLLDAAPDGIILVHRLDENTVRECCKLENKTEAKSTQDVQDGAECREDIWGLLVHGCKVRCNACYLLQTTRIASSIGMTTRFCLIRAECFGPSLESQLESAWLL